MERWENRYTHSRSRAAQMAEHGRAERQMRAAIIALCALLVIAGALAAHAWSFRGKGDEAIVNRMRTESADAVGLAVNLSRYGGSDSAAILGRIRADVHAMDVLNELHLSLYGKRCVEPAQFTLLYASIDSYSEKLRNGTASLEEINNLVNGLNTLDALIQALK